MVWYLLPFRFETRFRSADEERCIWMDDVEEGVSSTETADVGRERRLEGDEAMVMCICLLLVLLRDTRFLPLVEG
jgi:hypothetical protein